MESAGFLGRVSQAEGAGMQCPPGLHGDSCETGAAELREQEAEVRVWLWFPLWATGNTKWFSPEALDRWKTVGGSGFRQRLKTRSVHSVFILSFRCLLIIHMETSSSGRCPGWNINVGVYGA